MDVSRESRPQLFLVDGHWGPPWPRGLFGVQEPELAAPTHNEAAAASSKISRDSTTVIVNKRHFPGEQETDRKNKFLKGGAGDVNPGDGPDVHQELLDPTNDGHTSSVAIVETLIDRKNRSEISGGMQSSIAHKTGHRVSKGKLVPMPLNLANKSYKKPVQQDLKAFLNR